MSKKEIKRLAILAGSGVLPRQVYDAARDKGIEAVVIGLDGETEYKYFKGVKIEKFPIHKISAIFRYLKQEDVEHITMAGKVARSDLARLLLDLKGAKLFARIVRGGLADNSILTTIIKFCEDEGFSIVGPEKIASNNVINEGVLTKVKPSKAHREDIKSGFKTLKVVAETDVGQALVIQSGLILGIEAAEGTDELIKRCGEIRQVEEIPPVLLKMCKPNQDTRVDLPCIGPKTIENIAKYGLAGVAVEAGKTLILDQKETIATADKLGVFICGV